MPPEQNLGSHRRYYPLYHFVVMPILGINLILRVVYAIKHWGARMVWWEVVVAFALLAFGWAVRVMVLLVQDRLIRLEEILRMQRCLPDDLRGRIGELTTSQLIGMRFCDDAELPDLTREVLAGTVRGREEIKKRIRTWRPDTLPRA